MPMKPPLLLLLLLMLDMMLPLPLLLRCRRRAGLIAAVALSTAPPHPAA
jgi:hypothetical protein